MDLDALDAVAEGFSKLAEGKGHCAAHLAD